jgi:tight adherence protein C
VIDRRHRIPLRLALGVGTVVALAVIAGFNGSHLVVTGVVAMGGALLGQRRRRRAAARAHQQALLACLPDVVDLLAATVDGGAATDLALARVAAFVDEPARTVLLDALAHGAESGIGARLCALDPALRPLGSLLQQSEELGVPISGALRLLAADARARARSAARERAAAAAPKMLLVVGALLAPASLLIVIGGQLLVLKDVAGSVLA